MDLAGRVGKVVNFQALDLLVDRRRASSAASGWRRLCAGSPARRRADPDPAGGSRRSQPVTPRLTSINAASIAGSRPINVIAASRQPTTSTCDSTSSGKKENDAALQEQHRPHSRRARSPPGDGAVPVRAGETERALEGAAGRRRSGNTRDRALGVSCSDVCASDAAAASAAAGDFRFLSTLSRGRSARWRCDRDCAWRNPSRRSRCWRATGRRPG